MRYAALFLGMLFVPLVSASWEAAPSPVGVKSLPGECDGFQMGDTTVLYDDDHDRLEFWYFTCNSPTRIMYGTSRDPYNLSGGEKFETNLPHGLARPSILKIGPFYHLHAADMGGSLYHFVSIDGKNWSNACGSGPSLRGWWANSAQWYNEELRRWEMIVEHVEPGPPNSLHRFVSRSGCSWSSAGLLGGGYGPWMMRFNGTYIVLTAFSVSQSTVTFRYWRGTGFETIGLVEEFSFGLPSWAVGSSVGDPSLVFMPDHNLYLYFSSEGNRLSEANPGVATDAMNRTVFDLYNVTWTKPFSGYGDSNDSMAEPYYWNDNPHGAGPVVSGTRVARSNSGGGGRSFKKNLSNDTVLTPEVVNVSLPALPPPVVNVSVEVNDSLPLFAGANASVPPVVNHYRFVTSLPDAEPRSVGAGWLWSLLPLLALTVIAYKERDE